MFKKKNKKLQCIWQASQLSSPRAELWRTEVETDGMENRQWVKEKKEKTVRPEG